jgi:serine protease Do
MRLSKPAQLVNARSIGVFALAVALLVAGAFAGRLTVHGQQARPEQLSSPQGPVPSPADLSRTFIGVAKAVKPTVVNINVVERAKRNVMNQRGFPQIPGFPFGDMQPQPRRGTGSGVIISADGYILTNNHVAGDAEVIKVKLSDGRELTGHLVGSDPETDLALVKIDANNLTFAKLGDSSKLEQGEWVVALGSPFGLEQTMTAGIVSATSRDLRSGPYDNYIQTDASINPGNSGGPLVNMRGEVVGINTMIFSQSGGSEGIGFAIPSELASKVYGQLAKNGKVTRGYLGVNLQSLSAPVSQAVGFEGTEGALIGDIADSSSPAAKAGLRSGDVIVEFNGRHVTSPKQLTEMVADQPVGKNVAVKYVRDGKTLSTDVKLGERPEKNQVARNEAPDENRNAGKLGLSVQTVTPEIAQQLKLKATSGAAIDYVQPGSPAAEAGLQQGDVIHRIDRTPIASADDMISAIKARSGEGAGEGEIVLQIERQGRLAFVSVKLG